MPLLWKADFSSQSRIPLFSAHAASETDRKVFGTYKQWTFYQPYPTTAPEIKYAHTTYGSPAPLWLDQNHTGHMDGELLYLLGILSTGSNRPPEDAYGIPHDLDLNGARLDMELLIDNVTLDKHVQLGILLQYSTTGQASAGRSANVNYIIWPLDGNTIDQQLGFTPAWARTTRETRSTGWTNVSIQIPTNPEDQELVLRPIWGRPDKGLVYGKLRNVQDMWDQSKCNILSIMLVAYCGNFDPDVKPMARGLTPEEGYGQMYCRKYEIHK